MEVLLSPDTHTHTQQQPAWDFGLHYACIGMVGDDMVDVHMYVRAESGIESEI